MCFDLQVEKEIKDDATRLFKSLLNFTRNVDDIQVSPTLCSNFFQIKLGMEILPSFLVVAFVLFLL